MWRQILTELPSILSDRVSLALYGLHCIRILPSFSSNAQVSV
jgi:hypothetical protein